MLIFAIPVLIFLLDIDLWNELIGQIFNGPGDDRATEAQNGIDLAKSFVVLPITVVSFSFAFLARTFALHVKFDAFLPWFQAVKKINTEMKSGIVQAAKNTLYPKSLDDKFDYSRVFYFFVNEQEVMRKMAFHFWEEYYALVQLSVFSIVSFICCIALWLPNVTNWPAISLSAIPLVLALASTLEARSKIPNLLKHMQAQIDDFSKEDTTSFHSRLDRERWRQLHEV